MKRRADEKLQENLLAAAVPRGMTMQAVPDVFYVPAAARAMGIPKKHAFRDCRHIRNAVVNTVSAGNEYLAYLPLCRACQKRLEQLQR